MLLLVCFSKQHERLSPAHSFCDTLCFSYTIHAMVDVISSNRWLKPALAAMDLAQMVPMEQRIA
ncbi:Sec63 Brl domain [Phytophthora infestans]|uniref:Sec63 Brl domain n=1 Tax=Phytophthora infestans TaxID=4787 RepID=A0A833W3T2_PHYIN|nr:Sec63 Brl domain [Phytophthora infestans]KAF4149692.1 Sec63 Brl domain [Phytophthora infestans]